MNTNSVTTADLIISNAKIYTSDAAQPEAQAIAVKDKFITKIGTDSEVLTLKGPNTKVIDARGKILLPGFVDNHAHPLWVGAWIKAVVDIFSMESKWEVMDSLKEFTEEYPEIPYVIGFSWHFDKGGQNFTIADLDSVSTKIPIVVWSYDAMGGWANSIALKLIQSDGNEFRVLGGQVDSNGKPTGEFAYFHQFNPFQTFKTWFMEYRQWEKVLELAYEGMKEQLTAGLRNGVTTANDVQFYPTFIPMVLDFKAKGGLKAMRIRASLYVSEHVLDDEKKFMTEMADWVKVGKEHSDDHLILGNCVKMYADGTLGNYTAWLHETYTDRKDYYGIPTWDIDKFKRVMEILDQYNQQAQTHACGDAATHMVVEGYAHVPRKDAPSLRHRIEHAELFVPGDIERMAELGIYAGMQPAHFVGDELVKRGLGKKRVQAMMPWKTMIQKGVKVSFGSDRCASNPWSPFAGILVANRRLFYDIFMDVNDKEALTIKEAIYHYTYGSAMALGMEDQIGSLAVGKWADMVLLRIDDLDEIGGLWTLGMTILDHEYGEKFVDKTFVDGRIVYERK